MTIKLVTTPPPQPQEGQALITEIGLPAELQSGSSVTGFIKIQNIGAVSDGFRLLFTTEWDSKQYATPEVEVPVNAVLTATIPAGLITMPEIDAVITLEGQHLEAGVWKTDDTKSH